MNSFKIIAITHKNFSISEIGKFHIDEKYWAIRLSGLKKISGIEELMFLSTCNRVEFLLNASIRIDKNFLEKFILSAYPRTSKENLEKVISSAQVFENGEALEHLFHVASSLDSLVVGEREIISQVRNAYELSRKLGLTGDLLRLVVQKTIECAKEVYTRTNIANKPVSVVSLAYRKLKELHVKPEARIVMVGAGITNSTMAKYLKKHGLKNFTVFNRTLSNAEILAAELGGKAFPLEEIKNYKDGFDVLISCTGSAEPVITKKIYSSLCENEKAKKILIDLAVPNDIDENVLKEFDAHYIAIASLKSVAELNLQERQKEMDACHKIIASHLAEFEQIFKERRVELAMSNVPKKVKEIRETAVNEVFAKDIEKMDERSKEILEKVISYLEKKYISVPMKMAKEILLEKSGTNGKMEGEAKEMVAGISLR